jgi:hypothetical protein
VAALLAVSGVLAAGMPANAVPAVSKVSSQSSTYELTIGGHTTTLAEGTTAVYPMIPTTPTGEPTVSPNAVYPGDGSGTLTVTASNGVYHYSIEMHVPATNFVGGFTITDLTSGLSGGRVLELVFAGDIPTSKLHGHRYSGHLDGYAVFAGVVVSEVGPNATLYTYP